MDENNASFLEYAINEQLEERVPRVRIAINSLESIAVITASEETMSIDSVIMFNNFNDAFKYIDSVLNREINK